MKRVRRWIVVTFTLDERHERVTVFDVSGDPERWERSLHDLFDSIRSTLSTSAIALPHTSSECGGGISRNSIGWKPGWSREQNER